MEAAEQELERRSRFLNSLILKKKKAMEEKEQHEGLSVRVRASDMGLNLQNHAFKCARALLDSMPKGKVDSKRIALSLKKVADAESRWVDEPYITLKRLRFWVIHPFPRIVTFSRFYKMNSIMHIPLLGLITREEFDSTYGPAWHCIVGTSFGSYVTHSTGGFLYFSIDKVYVLVFRTAVEPLGL